MRFGMWAFAPALLFDDGGGAGAGASSGGNTGATPPASPDGGTPSTTPGAAGTPATAQPGSGTPSGAPAKKRYEYDEDRSNWVPSHVIREARQKEAERRAQIERELEYERRRVAALTGVSMPKPPESPEVAQVREQFFQIFPQFKALADLDPEKLAKVAGFDFEALQRANQETAQRIWTNHGTRATQVFEAKAKELYGEIEPKQLKRMISAFAAEAQEDQQVLQRYEAGDFTVIEEWLADWSKGFIDPIRKQATQPTPGQLAARRLPRAGGGGAAVGQKPPSLKPSDGEKFHNAAFEAFQRSIGGR